MSTDATDALPPEPTPLHSNDDVAAALMAQAEQRAQAAAQTAEQTAEQSNEGAEETDDASASEETTDVVEEEAADQADDTSEDAVEDDSDENSVSALDDAEEVEHDQESADDEGDSQRTSLDFDTEVEVTVDGKTRNVPLKDLVSNYSGERAIEARYQAAQTAVTEVQKSFAQTQELLKGVFGELRTLLAADAPQQPSIALATSDPHKYVEEMAAFQAAQQGQENTVSALAGLAQRVQEASAQQQRTFTENCRKALETNIPEFGNEATRDVARKRIAHVASRFGFTNEEIRACVDPRLFQMAHALGQIEGYAPTVPHNAGAEETAGKAAKVVKRKPKTKTLRSKAAKTRKNSGQQVQQRAMAELAKDGSNAKAAAAIQARYENR